MKIKELRENNKLTQKECAKALDIDANTFGRYELGKREPDIKMLCKIADYFGVSLDYLCERTTHGLGDFGYLNPDQMQTIKILLSLPEKQFYQYMGKLQNTADELNIKY
ncbi:MAG: helix-turn-helix domain-containing protein [Christensenellales bacterium]